MPLTVRPLRSGRRRTSRSASVNRGMGAPACRRGRRDLQLRGMSGLDFAPRANL
jgi:hypothetical protein